MYQKTKPILVSVLSSTEINLVYVVRWHLSKVLPAHFTELHYVRATIEQVFRSYSVYVPWYFLGEIQPDGLHLCPGCLHWPQPNSMIRIWLAVSINTWLLTKKVFFRTGRWLVLGRLPPCDVGSQHPHLSQRIGRLTEIRRVLFPHSKSLNGPLSIIWTPNLEN